MSEEKKIIIDEDWKSQVEAEKAEAQQRAENKAPQEGAGEDVPMPPASFEMLLSTLATEALIALGQVPHPLSGKAEPHRPQAKYLIDTIEVLQEKTKGNLTAAEFQAIDNLLHQLRMAFVAMPAQVVPSSPE